MNFPAWFDDLVSLFFPRTCLACGKSLLKHEEFICDPCLFHLPRTHFHKIPDNPVARTFWGRVNVEAATAFLYFRKGTKVQKLIHELKYKEGMELGVYMGRLAGLELLENKLYSTVDVVIPVPLYKQKLRKRGYNQSSMIAEGLAGVLRCEMVADALVRVRPTATQTRKGRYERWTNVERQMEVRRPELIRGKHVLLVDDVITTGATAEACIQVLTGVEGVRVSFCALGCA